jgi:ADP-heptose:LPS heptosyltransferase
LLKRQPRHAGAQHNLGLIALQRGRPADALPLFERALGIDPGQSAWWSNRSIALHLLGRPVEALAALDRALALDPRSPQALNNRSTILAELDRVEEALADCERALALAPGFTEALANRAGLLLGLNRLAEADAVCSQLLGAAPRSAEAHWTAALVRLLAGDLARGLPEYEWRWQRSDCRTPRRDLPAPLWRGEQAIAGQTILVHPEQGLGDTIQFCRYARLLADRGANVVLEVQPVLRELLACVPGASRVLAWGEPHPPFDLHCPLLSLPLACGTTLASIPGTVPYLQADPVRVAAWEARLGPRRRPRVGLVWSGSAFHANDRRRSIPLSALLPLLAADADFLSLQRDLREADRALLAAETRLMHLGAELPDFASTAALMACLDLVITVDTAPAHLAGALGRPVWILLPFAPDWRWLLNREDSPWYPTARLFRQASIGDWTSVVSRLEVALVLTLGAANSGARPAGRS